jgi:cytochrome P450
MRFGARHDAPRLLRSSWVGGNARELGRDGLAFYEACERQGPIVRGRAYAFPFYVVTGPELIEEILVKQARAFHKPGLLKGLRILFGDGLLTADGELWRHRRRLLQPVFQPSRQAAYGAEIARGIADKLGAWQSGGVIDVHDAVLGVCIGNLTRALFGIDDARLSADIRELAGLCHDITRAGMSFRFPYYGLLAMFPPLAHVPFGAKLRRLERSIVERVRVLRRGLTRDDFFARLTQGLDHDGCPMRGRAVRDELVTMLLAGHETAAAATSWALYCLARAPEIRAALARELDAVCGERLPTHDDLERLPLLQRVLQETYRLYPPTHRIGRTVVEPVSVGGVELELGAQVLIPQWAVQRSARHFEAPLAFRPDRWLDPALQRLPRFAYFPFGGGPRVCIGQALVTMEDALVLGSIVKSFDFSLPAGVQIEPSEGLTLLPGDGSLPLRLRRRERSSSARSSLHDSSTMFA